MFLVIIISFSQTKTAGQSPRPKKDLNKTTAGCCAAAVREFLETYRLAIGAVREGKATKPDVLAGCCRFQSRTRIVFTESAPPLRWSSLHGNDTSVKQKFLMSKFLFTALTYNLR